MSVISKETWSKLTKDEKQKIREMYQMCRSRSEANIYEYIFGEENFVPKPEIKSIEERADEYIGHPYEIDEGHEISMSRTAFIKGAESEHKILTNWYTTKLFPPAETEVLVKDKYDDYIVAYFSYVDHRWYNVITGTMIDEIVGWRFINN